MKSSVTLIGFMATGKTVVGKILAARLSKRFIEMDALVEQKAGKPIPRIFAEDGEIAFRELEIAVVKEISGLKNAVIAAGGGVVLNRINIDRFKKESIIILLNATPAEIIRRTTGDANRPLLQTEDPARRIRELLKFRKPFYERAADIIVNTARLSVDEVVGEIINRLKEAKTP